MTMSRPASAWCCAWSRTTAERGDEPPRGLHLLDHLVGRRAERVRDETHLVVTQRHLDLGRRGGVGPPEQLAGRGLALRKLGYAVLAEDVLGELDVPGGHQRAQVLGELLGIGLAHALVLARDDDVDAVGRVADVLVDPVELDPELLGREANRTEHAEPAGLAHRRGDVAAVREGEDRVLDPELVTEWCAHGDRVPLLRCRGRPSCGSRRWC